jgi:hypothetical protein
MGPQMEGSYVTMRSSLTKVPRVRAGTGTGRQVIEISILREEAGPGPSAAIA